MGSLGPDTHKALFEPSKHLWRVWGLILNMILPVLLSFWVFFFALGFWGIFFAGIQHSPVDCCSAVSCNFVVLTGEDECMSFCTAILQILVSRERLYSQAGVCDKDKCNNSLVFFLQRN